MSIAAAKRTLTQIVQICSEQLILRQQLSATAAAIARARALFFMYFLY